MKDSTLSIVLMSMAILTVVIGFLFLRTLVVKNRIARETAKQILLDDLLGAFLQGHITSVEDLRNLIEGFPAFSSIRIDLPWDLLNIVQVLKYKLSTTKDLNDKTPIQKINELLKETNQFLEQEKIKAPFENVPAIERNLLFDILELSGQKENTLFRDKLNRLSDQIITRQSTMEKLSVDSAKSLKTSKLSFWWGIIFFFISLGLSLYSVLK